MKTLEKLPNDYYHNIISTFHLYFIQDQFSSLFLLIKCRLLILVITASVNSYYTSVKICQVLFQYNCPGQHLFLWTSKANFRAFILCATATCWQANTAHYSIVEVEEEVDGCYMGGDFPHWVHCAATGSLSTTVWFLAACQPAAATQWEWDSPPNLSWLYVYTTVLTNQGQEHWLTSTCIEHIVATRGSTSWAAPHYDKIWHGPVFMGLYWDIALIIWS